MREHVHSGFYTFVFAGVSAIVFINLWRIAATKLAENDSTESIGRVMGGLVKL